MPTSHLLLAASLVAAVVYLGALAVMVVVLALRSTAHGHEAIDDRSSFLASRFSMPVSVVVPVASGSDWNDVAETVTALAGLNYAAFEIVVVADELSPGAWDAFRRSWRLEAREIFFRSTLVTAPIRMMYRSARDARLLVAHKAAGSPADALNCGVNLARFRYVCVVEPGLGFDPDALLRAMTGPREDPARVVGATSHVEISGGILQPLQSMRSLLDSHIVWRHLHAAVGPRESVVVWRRDAVEQAGGFDNVCDPHLDMMVKLQTAISAEPAGQIVRTAELFGSRRPRPAPDYVRQTIWRQRVAIRMLASWRRADADTRAMMIYFFASEVVTPFAQEWIVVATIACAAAGVLAWSDGLWVLLLVTARQGAIDAAARLVRGAVSPAPEARARRAA